MAEQDNNFKFMEKRGRQAGSQYNWEQWFDGNTWKLVQGVDFTCSIATMRTNISIAAKKHGVRVQTSAEGDTLHIRAALQ